MPRNNAATKSISRQGSASLIGRSYAEAALAKVMNAVKVSSEVVWEAEGGGLEMEEQMV
jgi:hypothetical protein